MSAEVKALDIETLFRMHYAKTARIIARVVRNRARAEELAVEVFLKLWRRGISDVDCLEAWISRVAARSGLDELRRQTRRRKYEGLLEWLNVGKTPATPEDLHRSSEEQDRVRVVLGALNAKQAEFLLLSSDGFSYAELAAVTGVNRASVGTTLARAREAFRKEYLRRYGKE